MPPLSKASYCALSGGQGGGGDGVEGVAGTQLGLRSKLNSTLETRKFTFGSPRARCDKAARWQTLSNGNAAGCDIVSAYVSIKWVCAGSERAERSGAAGMIGELA